MRAVGMLALMAGLTAGCGGSVSDLRARAAFDLKCQDDQLVVTDLGSNSKGVEGCGRRATYVWSPQQNWMMNGESSSSK